MHKRTLVCSICGVTATRSSIGSNLPNYCLPCGDRREDPLKRTAWTLVNRAVLAGKLPHASTLSCMDCGTQASDYDHRDYNKPLDVQPVCRKCNLARPQPMPLQRQEA